MGKKEVVTAEGLSAVIELKRLLENLDESKYVDVYDLLFASEASISNIKREYKIAEMKNLCTEFPKAAGKITDAIFTGRIIPMPDTGID